MKSPMVKQAGYITDKDKGRFSELQVLRSGAGYYIGTIYHNSAGYDEPGSRDSGYYQTREEAENDLALLLEGSPNAPEMRIRP